jgi:hypothetical protein
MTVAEALDLTDEALDAMIRHHNEQFHAYYILSLHDRREEGDHRALARWNSYERRLG